MSSMKRLGVCLDKLENKDLITSLNELAKEDKVIPTVFRALWCQQPVKNLFSQLEMSEAWGCRGNMLTENLTHVQKLLDFSMAKHKFLYITELEWVNRVFRFEDLARIYRHPQLKLIVESQEDFNIVKNNWVEPFCIMPTYNKIQLEALANV